MANELILMAEPRTVLGKQVKALRREGLVPAVVYGPAVGETIQVSVNRKELERFYLAHGHATLFTLSWDGGSQQVFIKEVQVEPVRRAPLHVDFFAPNLLKELVVRVPVVLHGLDPLADGVLNQVLDEVEVRALPTTLPSQIDANISGLMSPQDVLRAGDLKLPDGVTLTSDADSVIATLVAPEAEVEEEVAEEIEEELAEETPEEGTPDTETTSEEEAES